MIHILYNYICLPARVYWSGDGGVRLINALYKRGVL